MKGKVMDQRYLQEISNDTLPSTSLRIVLVLINDQSSCRYSTGGHGCRVPVRGKLKMPQRQTLAKPNHFNKDVDKDCWPTNPTF